MLNRQYSIGKILIPHGILFGLIFACLSIQEAPPRVTSITSEISANESFSITFNKPLDVDILEGKLTAWEEDVQIPGIFRKTSTTLIFSPESPWESGSVYRIKIEALPAERSDTFTKPINQDLRIQSENFLFLSPDDQLMEADPKTGYAEPIVPDDIRILSYSLAPQNRFVAIYGPRDNEKANGILLGEKKDGKYSLTIFSVIETPKYSAALLCNNAQSLLILSQEKTGKQNLQYFTLDWKKFSGKETLQEWEVRDTLLYGGEDLRCSEDTARVLYRKTNDAFVTNFLGEASEDLLGVFNVAIGFSPKDNLLLLQKSVTESGEGAAYQSEVSIYQSDGTRSTLSESHTIFREASFNGNGTKLSILYVDAGSFASRVEVYAPNGNGWTKTATVLPPLGKRITHHALSLDGDTLALEVEPGEQIDRTPTNTTKIILWDLQSEKQLPFEWAGGKPRWEK